MIDGALDTTIVRILFTCGTLLFALRLLLRPQKGEVATMPSRDRYLSLLKDFLKMSEGMKPLGFGAILGVGRDLAPSRAAPTQVAVDYKVPGRHCLDGPGQHGSSLPLSILLSIFDDVSTWPIIGEGGAVSLSETGVPLSVLSILLHQPHGPVF